MKLAVKLRRLIEKKEYDSATMMVLKSGYFNSRWYARTYPDVVEAGFKPIEHYMRHGALEGRDPGPKFNAACYFAYYPEVRKKRLNPLLHYLQEGRLKGYAIRAVNERNKKLFLVKRWREALYDYLRNRFSKANYAPECLPVIDIYSKARLLNRVGDNRLKSIALSSGSLTFDKGSNPDLEEFSALLPTAEVISFDLFDTLIERQASAPRDLFDLLSFVPDTAKAAGQDFRLKREEAEEKARLASGDLEVTIDDIYEQLNQDLRLSFDQLNRLKQAEIDWEFKCCRAKITGKQLFDLALECNREIVIISDTYLTESLIFRLLHSCGYRGWNRVFLSSDCGLTKHSGKLFDYVLQELNLKPVQLLHVGDNSHSDIMQAGCRGIKTIQVKKSIDLYRNSNFNEKQYKGSSLWDKLDEGVVSSEYGRQVLQTGISEGYLGSPYYLGYSCLGPILLGFSNWLLKEVESRTEIELCFLARDSYYFKIAFDMVADKLGEKYNTVYAASSRKLCYLAGMNSPEDMLACARVDHYPMALKDFLKHRFNLELTEEVQAAIKKAGFWEPEVMLTKEDPRKEKLLRLLEKTILSGAKRSFNRYRDYLLNIGVDWDNALLVDIGYAGTAQRIISSLVGAKLPSLYLINSEKANMLDREGYDYRAWADNSSEAGVQFFRYIQNWEILLSAAHGSVVGIDDNLKPIFDQHVYDYYTRGILALLRRGAIDYVKHYIDSYADLLGQFDIDFSSASSRLTDYFMHPRPEDSIYFSSLIFEDNFGGQYAPLVTLGNESQKSLKGIWKEASTVVAANRDLIRSPYWPLFNPEPVKYDEEFYDKNEEDLLLPACSSSNYEEVFNQVGFPRQLAKLENITLLSLCNEAEANRQTRFEGVWQADHVKVLKVMTGPELEEGQDQSSSVRNEEPWKINPESEREWVLITDSRTILEPSALVEFAAAIDDNCDIIYADDDIITDSGQFCSHHHKPGYSRQLLLSTDYFGGAWMIKGSVLNNLELRSLNPRAVLWEIAVQAACKTGIKVKRVPRILSHRLLLTKNEIDIIETEAAIILEQAFKTLGANCKIISGEIFSEKNKPVLCPVFSDSGPEVAIMIPTRNQVTYLHRCLESLYKTTYRNYHIYIIDNMSDESETVTYLAGLDSRRVTVLRIGSNDAEFSFSKINNRAVELTGGEPYLLFLNNDTEVIEPRWLSQMVGWQQMEGVGSVGAFLIYPNGTIQHAGITNRLLNNILPAPSFKLMPADEPVYQDYTNMARDCSAQTAACLLTPRTIFEKFGGFDQVDFNVAYNDCDYGFMLTGQGLWNVFCPEAKLYHYEGLTRGIGTGNDKPEEEAAFVQKYFGWADPFYNPNLALGRTDFCLQPTSPVTGEIPVVKTAFFSHNLNYEGAPLVLFDIVKGLKDKGTVKPLIVSMQDGELRQAYEDCGIEVFIVDSAFHLYLIDGEESYALDEIVHMLLVNQTEVVFANTVLSCWAIEAAELCRLPSLWLIHESEPPFTHLAENKARGERVIACPYRTIFVSRATREVYGAYEKWHNFEVIYNGFDLDSYSLRMEGRSRKQARTKLNIGQNSKVIFLPGTVCERKNQLELLKSLKVLDKSFAAECEIIILGDLPSSYSNELHRRVDRLPAEWRNAIRIVPYSSQIEEFYLAADILVSTSKIEAFPRVVQEGMFFGLAMVVAPVFGIVEQLQDEVNALFYKLGDFDMLARQLERLLCDERLRKNLGQKARSSLGRFPHKEQMIDEYEKLIKEAWLTV